MHLALPPIDAADTPHPVPHACVCGCASSQPPSALGLPLRSASPGHWGDALSLQHATSSELECVLGFNLGNFCLPRQRGSQRYINTQINYV